MADANANQPLRVLFVSAPNGNAVSGDQEFMILQDKLNHLEGVRLRPRQHATIEDIYDELLADDYDLFHLVAHGRPDVVQLADEGGVWAGSIDDELLLDTLRAHKSLRCVVFNACFSRSWIDRPFGPVLIAMNREIHDDAALAFSEGFYTALAGEPSDFRKAFDAGRRRVDVKCGRSRLHRPFDPDYLPECGGVIGIRSHLAWAPELHNRCVEFCDLEPYFPAEAEPDWSGAQAELIEFVAGCRQRASESSHAIHLDCPGTVALLAGRTFGPQFALAPFVGQQRTKRNTRWQPTLGRPLPKTSPWERREQLNQADAQRLVVSVSVSQNVSTAVRQLLEQSKVPVHWLDFRICGGPGVHAVRDADHAYDLARTLADAFEPLRAATGLRTIELFTAAPNPLLFFLGQQGAALGPLLLHEFDRSSGSYRRSVESR